MVYDDTRWIQKLKAVGVWNETEARQRFDEIVKRKAKQAEEERRTTTETSGDGSGAAGARRRHAGSITLFDAGVEEDKYRHRGRTRRTSAADGFDEITIAPSGSPKTASGSLDAQAALTIMSRVCSIRGHAREEFGKMYAVLSPLYDDLSKTKGHPNPLIFRMYRDPEQQAIILSSLKKFARADIALGWQQREEKLDSLFGVFENAVFHEFQQGLATEDIDGRMKRYAHVLVTLNGGSSGVDAFVSSHPIMQRTTRSADPLDCLEAVAPGHVDLNPAQRFFEQLAGLMVEQADVVDRVFPPSVDVLTPFLTRVCKDQISEYVTVLLDEAHLRGSETYVKTVSGVFEQALRFVASLKAAHSSPDDFVDLAKAAVLQCFEKHIDLYLIEELVVFKTKAKEEVSHWEKQLSDQQANAESFFMSNINRQAAKRDFLSSFRKVVMMPVNVLPNFPLSSPFASSKPLVKSPANLQQMDTVYTPARVLTDGSNPDRSSTPQPEPPTTELAAKAAIMNSRLEGIKSLFSIEVALNLTHFAKASLERAAIIAKMGNKHGDEAKKQCRAVFVELLGVLGTRHIKPGFDKAVEHLSSYNPRQVREYRAAMSASTVEGSTEVVGVEPLVTFLELVSVGDLIQQMVEVFYSQELVATKLAERDDFLDPAAKEKKRFEQMLDERVAAGLNKGIDVLMEEVEYICATTQPTTDFNPGAASEGKDGKVGRSVGDMDIGPSSTAKEVVQMVSGHTSMLIGGTDKNMLDVFMQEVGLRLFGVLCKHIKRQRISVDGSIKLIADINHYTAFIGMLRQKPLMPYFNALRELGQIYLVYIEPPTGIFGGGSKKGGKKASMLSTKANKTQTQAKELATIIADTQRYRGIFPAEEVYEFAERRADWYLVKSDVERAMYGAGCVVM